MKITILPKTHFGWWSIGLVLISILFFIASEIILGPGPDYNMGLAYVLTAIVEVIAVAAFITGLISIIREKERSILVFVAVVVSIYSLIGGIASLLGLAK